MSTLYGIIALATALIAAVTVGFLALPITQALRSARSVVMTERALELQSAGWGGWQVFLSEDRTSVRLAASAANQIRPDSPEHLVG